MAEDRIIVSHYQVQARYEFGLRLLDLALSKLNIDYEITSPYQGNPLGINEARGEYKVINGDLDLEFRSTSEKLESSMIPIRIPIYQGLLGLRLLLIKPSMNSTIGNVNSLEGLRLYAAGHGLHWGDLPVYRKNNLKVVTSTEYENLFNMLIGGRFDYFHRGVSEIWDELDRYSGDLVIADNIMLFYPHPVYFFVSKSRPELAVLIEKGLQMSINDGSYKRLFQQTYSESIRKARLHDRRLIRLVNPVIPQDTPVIDTSWWMPEKYRNN
jgi:hypothetical protein